MIYAIKDYNKKKEPIYNPEFLKEMNMADIKEMVDHREGNELPLLRRRLDILNTLGKLIYENYEGRFMNLVLEGKGNAFELVDVIISNLNYMKDSSTYKGVEIHFNKKSQLLVSDINQVVLKKSINHQELKDIDKLTACADYQLPNVLRYKGLLRYSHDLETLIDGKNELPKNGKEITEIRALTIMAVEKIKREMKRNVTSMQINDYLWKMASEVPMDIKYPRVRTDKF